MAFCIPQLPSGHQFQSLSVPFNTNGVLIPSLIPRACLSSPKQESTQRTLPRSNAIFFIVSKNILFTPESCFPDNPVPERIRPKHQRDLHRRSIRSSCRISRFRHRLNCLVYRHEYKLNRPACFINLRLCRLLLRI